MLHGVGCLLDFSPRFSPNSPDGTKLTPNAERMAAAKTVMSGIFDIIGKLRHQLCFEPPDSPTCPERCPDQASFDRTILILLAPAKGRRIEEGLPRQHEISPAGEHLAGVPRITLMANHPRPIDSTGKTQR